MRCCDHYERIQKVNQGRIIDIEKPIKLSFNERADLISFLFALNDEQFVFNKDYAFPEKLKNEIIKD